MERGYVYVVRGNEQYFQEALESVTSLKKVAPDAHATIVTDRPASEITTPLDRFDNIVVAPEEDATDTGASDEAWHRGLTFKVRHMYSCSPYPLTCFLDTDTRFIEDTTALFDLLEFYELVMSPAPVDIQPLTDRTGRTLYGYTSYNTGVIHFRKSEETRKLFESWLDVQLEELREDQPTFMKALLESSCRVYVTQPTFNARLPFAGRFVGKVSLVHSRPKDMNGLSMDEAIDRVNSTERQRLWLPGINDVVSAEMSLVRWSVIASKVSLAVVARDVTRSVSWVRDLFGKNKGE